jgi:hypothetical protein
MVDYPYPPDSMTPVQVVVLSFATATAAMVFWKFVFYLVGLFL